MEDKKKWWHFILKFFKRDKKAYVSNVHLEPKYWPEVMDFIQRLRAIIDESTIEDENIKIVNQRIVDYIEHEINVKGSIEDINKRYDALHTLADRILVKNISKLVGLKYSSTNADFSETIEIFKHRLTKRQEEELQQMSFKKN